MMFRLPCSILVIMWFLLLRGLCHALWPSPFGAACRSQTDIWNSSPFSHYLIFCSPNLPFCFSLGRKSWPSSQDLLRNLCPPKYVFPLATCLHLEFSPGRKITKSFQFLQLISWPLTFQMASPLMGVTYWKSAAKLSYNKKWSLLSSDYLKPFLPSYSTGNP